MSMTYSTKEDIAMKTSRRTFLSRVMRDAWNLARQGSQKFGGNVTLYFAIALRLVWQSRKERPATVWHPGLGNQFLMPGLSMPSLTNGKRQILLPGLSR